MLLGGQNQVAHIGHVIPGEHATLPAGNLAAGQKHGQAGQGHGQHHPHVKSQHRRGHHQATAARHQARQTQATQDVEGVAAHHVAHGHVALALDGGGDGGGHLGHGGTRRHDGQGNHHIAHAERLGKGDGGGHQPVGAQHQQGQSGHDQGQLGWQLGIPVGGGGRGQFIVQRRLCIGSLCRIGPARLHHQKRGVRHQNGQQQPALPDLYAPVQRQQGHQHRYADHDGHFLADELAVDHQRHDEGTDAQNEQHVENVAAHHIAHRHVGLARQHGGHRHPHLWRAGAKGHDGQAHHQGRDAKRQGQLARPAHQQVGPEHQCGQASHK